MISLKILLKQKKNIMYDKIPVVSTITNAVAIYLQPKWKRRIFELFQFQF